MEPGSMASAASKASKGRLKIGMRERGASSNDGNVRGDRTIFERFQKTIRAFGIVQIE